MRRADSRTALLAGILALAGCQGEATPSPVGALKAIVASCVREAGAAVLRIQFHPTEETPDPVAALLPRLVLRAYDYAESGAPENHVGGYPPNPDAMNLLPASDTGASVEEGSPPVASIPSTKDVTEITFRNVLLTVQDEITLETDDFYSLAGTGAETPLGRISVQEAQEKTGGLEVVYEFAWADGLQPTSELQPKGVFVSELRAGRDSAYGDISYVVGQGTSQTLTYDLPSGEQRGPVTISLIEWGILVPGPIALHVPAEACAPAQ